MPELTVRTVGGDIGGDTIRFEADVLLVMSQGETIPIPLEAVRCVIAGRPVDDAATPERGEP